MFQRAWKGFLSAVCLVALVGPVAAASPDFLSQFENNSNPQDVPVDAPMPIPVIGGFRVNAAGMVLPDQVLPKAEPAPRPALRVAVKRQVAACVLFTVHPLLAMVPTDELVQSAQDHPCCARAACGCAAPVWNKLSGALSQMVASYGPPVAPVPDSAVRPCVIRCCESSEEAPMAAAPPCTWAQSARPNLVHQRDDLDWIDQDVLQNLEALTRANALYKKARKLLEEGHLCEALEAFDTVCQSVPGSRFEAQVQQTLNRYFAGTYGPSKTEPLTEAAGEEEAEAPKPTRKYEEQSRGKTARPALASTLDRAISVRFDDQPLRQAVEQVSFASGFRVEFDTPALQQAGISMDRPVTLRLEQAPCEAVIRLLLLTARLTYVDRQGVLLVTTPERAKDYADGDRKRMAINNCPGACVDVVCPCSPVRIPIDFWSMISATVNPGCAGCKKSDAKCACTEECKKPGGCKCCCDESCKGDPCTCCQPSAKPKTEATTAPSPRRRGVPRRVIRQGMLILQNLPAMNRSVVEDLEFVEEEQEVGPMGSAGWESLTRFLASGICADADLGQSGLRFECKVRLSSGTNVQVRVLNRAVTVEFSVSDK